VLDTEIDEISGAHRGGHIARADDRSGGMRFQSNCISFSSTDHRFSDSFCNSYKGDSSDSEAHSDA
jgi:hypothetical protein